MNSVIQCLSNTRQLLEYALNENYANDVNKSTSSMKGQLITAFAHLLQVMNTLKGSQSHVLPLFSFFFWSLDRVGVKEGELDGK